MQMWSEMTISPTKFGYSQRWIETYAGYVGESVLLEQLYEANVKPEYQIDLSYEDEAGNYHDLSDLEVYANGGRLALWNTVPRLEWQTPEYYAEEEGTLLPNEFLRIHRNQWVSSVAKFVPDEWWENCRGTLPAIKPRKPFESGSAYGPLASKGKPAETPNGPHLRTEAGTQVILAVDAGVSDDNFALVGIAHLDGRAVVWYAKLWQPPAGGKIDYLGTPENPGPEREIVRLCARYNVREVRYDPYQLHDMATRLARGVKVGKGGQIAVGADWVERVIKINTVEFSQGAPRLEADKQWYDKIRDGKVIHNGDPDLAAHVQNSNAKTENERLRIVKRSQALKIDLNVAAATAAYEPEEKKEKKPTRAMRVTR
jgi:hypothetical protein